MTPVMSRLPIRPGRRCRARLAAVFALLLAAVLPGPAQVQNGIDILAASDYACLRGLRVGLVTNQTGTDGARNASIDLLFCAPGVTLAALFSPEHGIRGLLDQNVGDSVDERTGVPIYSLYGQRRAPEPEELSGLDALVFDIQDIGCRFYTYASTMGLCLEAASRSRVPMLVLDRVNPINGAYIDGPVLADATSFIAYHAIPVRHAMTVGELALMFNEERRIGAELSVIPVVGWSRSAWFDATGLPWTNPSPNMRSLTEATLYPGVGLLEMTNLSVGRGTGTPFELVGAPYIDDLRLAAVLNNAGVSGVRFVPVRFTPTASVFKDKPCGGVGILLLDRQECSVVDVGIAIAQAIYRLYPQEFEIDKLNRLLGHPATVDAIKAGKSRAEIRELWAADLKEFSKRRERYLLYR